MIILKPYPFDSQEPLERAEKNNRNSAASTAVHGDDGVLAFADSLQCTLAFASNLFFLQPLRRNQRWKKEAVFFWYCACKVLDPMYSLWSMLCWVLDVTLSFLHLFGLFGWVKVLKLTSFLLLAAWLNDRAMGQTPQNNDAVNTVIQNDARGRVDSIMPEGISQRWWSRYDLD